MPIIPSTPKLRRFGQNGVVLQILGFFFFNEKKKEIKKKKGEIGVAPATPYRPYGGGRSHPRPLGVVRPPRKAKKKKKKRKKMGLGFWGWPDHPQGPGGGFGHPLRPASATPIRPVWGGQPPRFLPIFFILFYFISFFFSKKKKKNPKICKTTPFCPKWRSFGVEGIIDNLPPKGS
jgi:hypothetical protein